MKIIKDYERIKHLVDQIKVEKVYPLSITEGIQKGEVFVDHIEAPTVALLWHYCGFANISGKYDEKFVEETMNMMQNPQDGHSGRMALQILFGAQQPGDAVHSGLRTAAVRKAAQYCSVPYPGEGRTRCQLPRGAAGIRPCPPSALPVMRRR